MDHENRKNLFFWLIPSLEHPTEFCWVSSVSQKQEKFVFLVHNVTCTPHRILLGVLCFTITGKPCLRNLGPTLREFVVVESLIHSMLGATKFDQTKKIKKLPKNKRYRKIDGMNQKNKFFLIS
jgi:hypothetical protein